MVTQTYSRRWWIFRLYFLGWENVQLGVHLNWRIPNLEVHVPFFFLRAGRQAVTVSRSLRPCWGWEQPHDHIYDAVLRSPR